MEQNIIAELLLSEDGSHTLRHPFMGDTYHSVYGAVSEAKHVYIQAGFDYAMRSDMQVLEMGFGSGLNVALSMSAAMQNKVHVRYTAVELFPIANETIYKLNFFKDNDVIRPLFQKIHELPWNSYHIVNEYFSLYKAHQSFLNFSSTEKFDLVYYDAFAPDTQPELWSEEVFLRLAEMMKVGAVLVTYTSKGSVKQNLRRAGFEVKRLQGALGKHHMIRAIKQ